MLSEKNNILIDREANILLKIVECYIEDYKPLVEEFLQIMDIVTM